MNAQKMTLLMMSLSFSAMSYADNYARSIFVPRQLSYNPILENALMLDAKIAQDTDYIFSIKPIYTQTVGKNLNDYFLPCHKSCLNIQEDGSGDVSSLWFNVISSDTTFYSSSLSLHPKRQSYGSLVYAAFRLPCNFELSFMTAVLQAKHTPGLSECGAANPGTCPGYDSVTASFANCARKFGRIDGCSHKKTGVDDIQVKLIYNPCNNDCMYWDVYGLVGIPTGKGSKATYLFEPLVGSKHAQLGLGSDMRWNIMDADCGSWSLLSEVKYRYGFAGKECRSFDLCRNGQWSRYMLFVNESDPYNFFPAINDLTFKAKVTPGSSLDVYIATHYTYSDWNFELGYDLWYRSAEKISLDCDCATFPTVGVADLKGIAAQNPFTASTANISQGVQPGANQMVSDTSFVAESLHDINLLSGAQSRSLTNSVYGSVSYKHDISCYTMQVGLNVAYEHGSLNSTPSNVATWLNLDLYF